jgi:hypothetical protein
MKGDSHAMQQKRKHRRLAPLFICLLLVATLVGALASAAFGALSSKPLPERKQLAAYPKMSEDKYERVLTLLSPPLPFDESVSGDAFQDRAGLATAAGQAAFAAPVVQTGNGKNLPPPPSGYAPPVGVRPQPQTPAPSGQPQGSADDKQARQEVARRSGKLGTPQEASLYSWREVLPLGVAGYVKKNEQTGEVTEVRQVRFKSLVTMREFSAGRGTQFADSTLADVSGSGVIFRDAAGAHEVGWTRTRPAAGAQSGVRTSSQPAAYPAPSGYAAGVTSPAGNGRQN